MLNTERLRIYPASREQLLHGEGLRQIVVGSGVQTCHPVVHLGLCRQKKDRSQDVPRPQLGKHRQPVCLRHHDVEDDPVVALRFDIVQRFFPVRRAVHVVPLPGQEHGHGAVEVPRVLRE